MKQAPPYAVRSKDTPRTTRSGSKNTRTFSPANVPGEPLPQGLEGEGQP